MKTQHTLLVGDARSVLPGLERDSVHLVVTSPPYWNIKDYEAKGQIGFDQTYPQYLADLQDVWKECRRILHGGCKLVINIGDQFLRASENNGLYEIVPIHSDTIRICKNLGFVFLGSVIWQKITTTKTTGGCSWMGSIYYPRDGYVTYEHEYIMIFKKPGKAPKPTAEAKASSKLPKEYRSKWFRGVWDDVPPARQVHHQAMFPLEIPERLVRMFTFAGETVLDPFVGSGTTMAAAGKWGRSSIGIELNQAFLPLVAEKVPDVGVVRSAAQLATPIEIAQRRAS